MVGISPNRKALQAGAEERSSAFDITSLSGAVPQHQLASVGMLASYRLLPDVQSDSCGITQQVPVSGQPLT